MATNQIEIKGQFLAEEALAAGAIKPGHLLQLDSNLKVVVHATEGGYAERAFAKEDALQGKTTADAYASGDQVFYSLAVPGSVVNAMIKAGQNIAKGDKLISAGDGTLKEDTAITSGTTLKQIIAYAVETKDLSASGAVNTLAAVRVV